MKKLVLSMLALVSGNILAQPIAQNSQFVAAPNSMQVAGHLFSLVQGAQQPYLFELHQAQNANVVLLPYGGFTATITAMPASFQYSVRDASGDTSALATITLIPGPMLPDPDMEEKG